MGNPDRHLSIVPMTAACLTVPSPGIGRQGRLISSVALAGVGLASEPSRRACKSQALRATPELSLALLPLQATRLALYSPRLTLSILRRFHRS
jgi:hypothetical protein